MHLFGLVLAKLEHFHYYLLLLCVSFAYGNRQLITMKKKGGHVNGKFEFIVDFECSWAIVYLWILPDKQKLEQKWLIKFDEVEVFAKFQWDIRLNFSPLVWILISGKIFDCQLIWICQSIEISWKLSGRIFPYLNATNSHYMTPAYSMALKAIFNWFDYHFSPETYRNQPHR